MNVPLVWILLFTKSSPPLKAHLYWDLTSLCSPSYKAHLLCPLLGTFRKNEKSPKLDKSFINTYFFYLQLDQGRFVGCHVVLLFPSKLKEREEERMVEVVSRSLPLYLAIVSRQEMFLQLLFIVVTILNSFLNYQNGFSINTLAEENSWCSRRWFWWFELT